MTSVKFLFLIVSCILFTACPAVHQPVAVREKGEPFVTKSYKVDSLSFDMVHVQGGTFWMGAQSDEPGERNYCLEGRENEYPVHEVTLSDYAIGRYEVTLALWKAVTGKIPKVNEEIWRKQTYALPEDAGVSEAVASNPVKTGIVSLIFSQVVKATGKFVDETAKILGKDNFPDISRRKEIDGHATDLPVYFVSWEDTQEFLRILNKKLHADGQLPETYEFCLPTEAQWEYAARGGNLSKGYKYAGGDEIDQVAVYCGKFEEVVNSAAPVGTKKPNELGLYDMSGNVWEWCADWYTENYEEEKQIDPSNTESGLYRVARGGSWLGIPSFSTPSFRLYKEPDWTWYDHGFRLCLHKIQPERNALPAEGKTMQKEDAIPAWKAAREKRLAAADRSFREGVAFFQTEAYEKAILLFDKGLRVLGEAYRSAILDYSKEDLERAQKLHKEGKIKEAADIKLQVLRQRCAQYRLKINGGN